MNVIWVPQPSVVPTPIEVSAYLRNDNWQYGEADNKWATFSKLIDGEAVVLEVPQQTSAPDYGSAVALLIEDVARLEGRAASRLLRDIRASCVDLIRLAISGSSTNDGRIPVEAGPRVYKGARDLLLAAACSVIEPRSVFANRKPEDALTLLNRARFGQTELGSFVLTMECSVPPTLQQTMLVEESEKDAPYERRTCMRLARGLQGAAAAVRQSTAASKLEPFNTLAKEGVSANLCEAIVEILEATSAETFKAGFSFASCRPVVANVPREIAFSSDVVPVLREAAKLLRDEANYPSAEVIGTVVKLESTHLASGGDAHLRARWDGAQERLLKVSLDASMYKEAISAHREIALVRCVGDIAREKSRQWVLSNPRSFVRTEDS